LLATLPLTSALADGGGIEASTTPTPTLTPTASPAAQQNAATESGVEGTVPDDDTLAGPSAAQPTASVAQPAASGSASYLWPLGLLLLAIIAFGVIAFLLMRKK
jgi:hypothetical protein